MTIINGVNANADEVMNVFGSMFKDSAQLIYSTAVSESTLKNVFYQKTLSADVVYGFQSSIGDYVMPDLSSVTEYIIIEATSLSGAWNSNNCKTMLIAVGKWLVYCTTGTAAVHRAQIHKSLWYGTTGTNALIDDFTSVTSIQTSNANDVGKQAHYASQIRSYSSEDNTITYTGTFANTSTNNNCSFWSKVDFDTATDKESDELGTDTSSDELNNPATCQLDQRFSTNTSVYSRFEVPSGTTINNINHTQGEGAGIGVGGTVNGYCILLGVGDVTWVTSGTGTRIERDFYTDDSIPLLTEAGSLSDEGAEDGELIFKDTASATVTNTITTWNSTIDTPADLVVSISYNSGANYTTITDATIIRATPTGTGVWLKFVVTRTDTSKTDQVEEWATKYNLY